MEIFGLAVCRVGKVGEGFAWAKFITQSVCDSCWVEYWYLPGCEEEQSSSWLW